MDLCQKRYDVTMNDNKQCENGAFKKYKSANTESATTRVFVAFGRQARIKIVFSMMEKCLLTVLATTQMFRYARAVSGTFTEIPLTNPLTLFTLHFPSKPGKVATAVDGVVVALQVVGDVTRSIHCWHAQWTLSRIGRN